MPEIKLKFRKHPPSPCWVKRTGFEEDNDLPARWCLLDLKPDVDVAEAPAVDDCD